MALTASGPIGSQLDRLLKRAGVSREHFEIISLNEAAVSSETKTIVAFGEEALQELTGEVGILRFRGRVLPGRGGAWIIPTLHPADLLPKRGAEGYGALRNPPRFTAAVIWDIQRACHVAAGGFTRTVPSYLCDPSPDEFRKWAKDPLWEGCPLSLDIETPYKLKNQDDTELDDAEIETVILRISFSHTPGTGVSVPWTGPYLQTIRDLLESPGIKIVWNGDAFDVPLLVSQGFPVNGSIHDAMWLWHLYQTDLPMGLEFASSFWSDLLPWKHLNNSDPVLYSAIDADAALRNYLGCKEAVTSRGQWPTFLRHIVQLDPLLYEAGQRGSQIDLVKQAQLREELTLLRAKLVAEAQGMVPQAIKPRKRFKKCPKIFGPRIFEEIQVDGQVKQCSVCKETGVTKTAHFKGKANACKAAGATLAKVAAKVVAWDEVLAFNPNSTQQIQAYITHFGHPLGRSKQDRERVSADSRHLAKLSKRYGVAHPIYQLTITFHQVSKAKGTYVDGFTPDAQGFVHTTYGHTPSTWRLSSRNINLQNVGKREGNQWAKEARKQITARPGNVLVQADSSALEAVFVGHCMGSSEYIDLARRGIHDCLACRKLAIPFTPENQKLVKREHKTLRDQCKITVHGTSYGMTPKLMIELFPDLFPTESVASQFQEEFFLLVPELKRWQHETRVRAHRETYLETEWKIRHYFYHVLMQDSFGNVTHGGDANRAVAFKPQSMGGSFMKDNIVLLGDTWGREWMPAHLSVHDSLCLDVPSRLEEKAVDLLTEILTRPIPELGGLQVGCEVEVGLNWAEMESVRVVRI